MILIEELDPSDLADKGGSSSSFFGLLVILADPAVSPLCNPSGKEGIGGAFSLSLSARLTAGLPGLDPPAPLGRLLGEEGSILLNAKLE